jgi:hypothetical protein
VSAGSPAERCGIRVGDVVECFNGKCVSTVVEVWCTRCLLLLGLGRMNRYHFFVTFAFYSHYFRINVFQTLHFNSKFLSFNTYSV